MKRLWCIILAALLLVGCHPSETVFPEKEAESLVEAPEESSKPESEDPAPPAAESESSEEQPEPEPESEPAEPVRRLNSFSTQGFIRSMEVYPNGDILICASKAGPEADYTLDDTDAAVFYRIDPREDQILAQAEAGSNVAMVFGVCGEDGLACWNAVDGRLDTYDADFACTPGPGLSENAFRFYYDRSQERLCYVESSRVYTQKIGEDPEILVENAINLDLATMNKQTGQLVLNEPSDRLDLQDTLYLYDPQEKKFSNIGVCNFGQLFFCGSSILNLNSDWMQDEPDTRVDVLDPENGGVTVRWQLRNYENLYCDENSDYLLGFSYSDTIDIRLIDPWNGRYADVSIPEAENIIEFSQAVWNETLGVWIAALMDSENQVHLYQIDPQAFEFSKVLSEAAPIAGAEPVQSAELGADFAEVRARADEIEAKYGVRILIGNEIFGVDLKPGYTLISAEDPDYADFPDSGEFSGKLNYPEENVEILQKNLDLLDQEFAAFPEDFFSHFVGGSGEGGLRIALVRALINEDGAFQPGGCQTRSGPWFNLIINMTLMDRVMLQHELWHAVETRITLSDLSSFDAEEWNKLNPEGFTYSYDFEAYATEGLADDLYDYLLWSEQDPYFIRDYSMTNDMEDRATMIESLYDVYYNENMEETSNYDRVMSYPHLKAKLDFMAERTEKVFGSVYWQR